MAADSHGGRVALVTGAAQGIGRGIVDSLRQQAWRIVAADVDPEAGAELIEDLGANGSLAFVATDVGDEASVSSCLATVAERYGRLDGLVNNAGLASPARVPPQEQTLEAWNRVLATNLTGCFLMSKHAASLLSRTGGAIVNIASTRALQSEPCTEAYSASKGGVIALTHALAASLAPRVRVNCVSPGWIDVSGWKKRRLRRQAPLSGDDHSQHWVGRVGRPGDIGEVVAFLLSDKAAFITGQNFVVDGGMTRKMIYVE